MIKLQDISISSDVRRVVLPRSIMTQVRSAANIIKHKGLINAPPLEIIGELTGFETIMLPSGEGCSGYCDLEGAKIAIAEGRKDTLATIFHEIGHVFQANECDFDRDYYGQLSSTIKMEQQAESIAYNLLQLVSPDSYYLPAYFTKESVEFLREWFCGWIPDDLKN